MRIADCDNSLDHCDVVAYNLSMTLQEIENSIAKMSPAELAEFRAWFLDFDSKNLDERISTDVAAGRLDELADSAIRDHQSGRSTEL